MLAALWSAGSGGGERITFARLLCGLDAWLWGLWGLALLRVDASSPIAVAGLILAAVLGVLALGASSLPWRSSGEAAAGPRQHIATLTRRQTIAGAGLATGLLLTLGADLAFVDRPREAFGLAGWLWLLSIACLVGSAALWSRHRNAAVYPAEEPPRWTRREAITLLLLVGLAIGLRIANLREVPFAIHHDEILTGSNAIQSFPSLHAGTNVPLFVTVWDNIDLPAAWFLLVATSVELGGHTLESLRMPAALFGAAIVVPFYLLVRAGWGSFAAVSGTLVLAASAAALQYSRVTINNIVTPFFWSVCFFFLLSGVRTGRARDWVLAGLAAGLSEYGYYGTHLLPFVLVGFLAYLLVTRWQAATAWLGRFGLLVVGYVVGFGPLLAYFVRFRPDIYFGRGSAPGVLMWDHIPRDLADLQLMWQTLWPLLVENLLGFNTHGGLDSFFFAPLLMASETALLAIGVALLIWQWRRPAAFLMLLSGFGVLFVGGTLIHGTPYFVHWTPAFPAIYTAIAVAIGAWARLWRGVRGGWSRVGPALVILGLSANLIANVDFYFNRYAPPLDDERGAAQSRWHAALGTAYRGYTAGATRQPFDAEVNSYLIRGQEGAALEQPERQLPVPDVPGTGLAFAFLPDNEAYQGLVASVYPGGAWGEVRSRTGVHLFNTYVVAPTDQPIVGTAPIRPPSIRREVTVRPPKVIQPAAVLAAGVGLSAPRGVAVNQAGELLVADTGNQRVLHMDSRGAVLGEWPGAFELLAAIGVTADDEVVTIDGRSGMLQRFSPDGRLILTAPLGTSNANALAVGHDGRLWVADTSNSRVAGYGLDGRRESELRGGAQPPERFEQPIAVALGSDGTMFAMDLRGRIAELNDQGLVTREWPVQFGTGRGVSQLVVWQGLLVVSDPERHRLEVLDPTSGELRYVGEEGHEPGQFRRPLGLATDGAKRLYVVDSDNARIQVFTTLDAP